MQWSAWSKLAQDAGYDPVDYIKMMVIERMIRAKPPVLRADEVAHLERVNRLIRKVVGIASRLITQWRVHAGHHVARIPASDARQGVRCRICGIGGMITIPMAIRARRSTRELGRQIKNAMPVEVETDKDGKRLERRNLKGR